MARDWWSRTLTVRQLRQKISWYLFKEKLAIILHDKVKQINKKDIESVDPPIFLRRFKLLSMDNLTEDECVLLRGNICDNPTPTTHPDNKKRCHLLLSRRVGALVYLFLNSSPLYLFFLSLCYTPFAYNQYRRVVR